MKQLTKLWWFLWAIWFGGKKHHGRYRFLYGRGHWYDIIREEPFDEYPKLEFPFSAYVLRATSREYSQLSINGADNIRSFYSVYPKGQGEYKSTERYPVGRTLPLGEHPWKGVISTWWGMWKVLPK